jgi:uncharacterized protein (TIGR00269 family)
MSSDKEFVRKFESNVRKTISKFKLLEKSDRILVAVSGGKDSSVVLYLLKKFGYKIDAITVDVQIGKYTKENLENIRKFCKTLGVKLNVVSFRDVFGSSLCHIVSLVKSRGWNVMSCTVCGVLRRYLINRYCRKLKAAKVVTGHNLDDEAQAFLMNLFKNKQEMNARLGPYPGIIRDSKFVPRVKPLYLTKEADIERYSRIMNLPVKYGRCPCAVDAYRNYVRNMLNELEKEYPKIKENLIKYFLRIRPKLKKRFISDKKLLACKLCGEPSQSDVCRACQILGVVKNFS